MTERCRGCGAPHLPMAYCPECQRPYATEPAARAGSTTAESTAFRGARDDARGELLARAIAPPAVLLLAFLIYGSEGGRAFFRVFVSMWVHELGHAVAAWSCGYAALPGPWRTSIPDERSVAFVVMVAGALGAFAYRAWRADRRGLAGGLVAVALLQVGLSLGLSARRADAFFTFFGDGGAMVLGAALMATFHVPPGHHLERTQLRWGFLVIGAFGFMDPFREWLAARRNPDVIAYGEIEGVGLSDPTKLVDVHGWAQTAMISRYLAVGVICLVVVAATYARGVLAARRAGREQNG